MLMFMCTTVLYTYMKSPQKDVHKLSDITHVRSKIYQDLYQIIVHIAKGRHVRMCFLWTIISLSQMRIQSMKTYQSHNVIRYSLQDIDISNYLLYLCSSLDFDTSYQHMHLSLNKICTPQNIRTVNNNFVVYIDVIISIYLTML